MDSEKQSVLVRQHLVRAPSRRYGTVAFATILLIIFALSQSSICKQEISFFKKKSCVDPDRGFICSPKKSQFWGQYSPYFKVNSDIPDKVPKHCEITFAQILSRHGARDPTLKRTIRMSTTMTRIKARGRLEGKYAFIKDYTYNLGADQLNELGRRQLRQSGHKAHERYGHLGDPFIRASSQQRVVDSAASFIEGFGGNQQMLILSEDPDSNNTLHHSQCPSLEYGPISKVRKSARKAWGNVFLPRIATRLSKELGMSLSQDDAHNLMSMCPMTTVHDPEGRLTPFCDLFTHEEFTQYNHFESLEKFYGWGKGNPLGPSQGVGWANELIARMLRQPVQDSTSTNRTLDSDPVTFPLDRNLYADFSHDDDLTAAFFAVGLFSNTPMLSIASVDSTADLNGWTPARTVPFAGRGYFEKMKCKGHKEELVRALVNERVIPLDKCKPDKLGRCTLSNFIESLEFVKHGGNWPLCYEMVKKSDQQPAILENVLSGGLNVQEDHSPRP